MARQGTAKCGWCLDGFHDTCRRKTITTYPCPCTCNTKEAP